MASITVTVDDKTVLDVLRRITQRFTADGLRPAMKEIGEELAESTTRRFTTLTGPDGKPWRALEEGTILARYRALLGKSRATRKKKGKNAGQQKVTAAVHPFLRPLDVTGELRRSIRYQVTDGGASVSIGTNRTFSEDKGVGAEVHQFGTKTIPARPFLGLSQNDKTTVLDILNELIHRATRP
jgi:phage gpG-like protein